MQSSSSARRVDRSTRRGARRRTPGCLTFMLILTIVGIVGGLLAYALLLIPSPTNLLVLGIDRRPQEGHAVRSDTILLIHADTASPRVVLLSIPRDLWVNIPGRGKARINTAHVYGELDTPGNGPALVAETINLNFAVPVDRTLRLDFDAFREVIDAAGGVEIDVPIAIIDNAYPTEDYGTMRVEIQAGSQHMDGRTALQYARSRSGSNDFDRASRQQQVFAALAKKMTSPNGWLLIPRVYQAFTNAVETNLSPRDLVRLAMAWLRAGEEGLEKIVIDQTMTTPFRTPQGAEVLQPRWDLIQPLVGARFDP